MIVLAAKLYYDKLLVLRACSLFFASKSSVLGQSNMLLKAEQ